MIFSQYGVRHRLTLKDRDEPDKILLPDVSGFKKPVVDGANYKDIASVSV